MKNKTLTWIAYKYFTSKKSTGLVSFTSWVSILGIGLGSFALVITLSVLNGFEREMARRVINIESHIEITGQSISHKTVNRVRKIVSQNNLKANKIAPFVNKKAILTANDVDAAVKIKGIDSLSCARMFHNRDVIHKGSAGFKAKNSKLPGIMMGYKLADKLGIYVGDTINVINPLEVGGTMNIPYLGKFVLTGVYQLNLFNYDNSVAFINIGQAQRIYRMKNNFSGINITFQDYKNIEEKKRVLENKISNENLEVKSWRELHRSLFGAMKLEKYGSFLALSFIVLVAIFNLTSSLVMLVMEKINQIGMLQALGMNKQQVKSIFVRLGFLTGSLGLGAGIVLSVVLSLLQQYFQFIPLPAVYFIKYVPVEVHILDLIIIGGTGLLMIYLGTLYPSKKISDLRPLEAINYEK